MTFIAPVERPRIDAGRIEALPGFDDGAFWVQDAASAWMTDLVPAEARTVLDACAAPGGKTAQLLPTCRRVVAADLSPLRLRRVSELSQRLGRTIQTIAEDARHPAGAGASFDRVLVDVPCSGTGVLRRHPEARWRKQAVDLPRQAQRQYEILVAAFARLRPGGVLVYSTCSLEEEENDAVVDRFLAAHPEARLEPASALFPDQPWARRTVQRLPGRDDGDGAYAARIRREPSA